MPDLGYGRMAAIMRPSDRAEIIRLRDEYAARIEDSSHLGTHYALAAAAEYIEALEKWVAPGE